MEQIEKNTVPGDNQLKGKNGVFFIGEGKGLRVLFVGNSITLHPKAPEIGWDREWGMAASAPEKDYVHILISKIREKNPDAAFCVVQVSEWERQFMHGEDCLPKYQRAAEFGADVIIMRLIENCPYQEFDDQKFMEEYQKFIDFLNRKQKAKVVVTTGFWRHKGDDAIRQIAKKQGYPLVELGDLGEMDEMKAIGLFDHEGVANHPGDLGMEKIAERIFEKL